MLKLYNKYIMFSLKELSENHIPDLEKKEFKEIYNLVEKWGKSKGFEIVYTITTPTISFIVKNKELSSKGAAVQ